MTKCSYSEICTGCSLWNMPYSKQKLSKISYLQNLIKDNNLNLYSDIEFVSCGEFGLRHRVDFTIEFDAELNRHKVGFYDTHKKLIHIEHCLQMDSALQKIYFEFMAFKFYYGAVPIKKGSVRLRTGPDGSKGCWLDFSNIEIKYLLEDKKLLTDILNAGFIVEIGQKGKKLQRDNDTLKLTDPAPAAWFKTRDHENQDLVLNCLISDFTQPSWTTAAVLVKVISDWISERKDIRHVLEFGSGIGQFTLSFLKQNLAVTACEINESAMTRLLMNAKLHRLEENLSIQLGDFHKTALTERKFFELVFVNPARSGLRNFTDEIIKSKAEYLMYVSCFPETMIEDLVQLSDAYSLCNIKIIDQFPQTEHFETCALLKKLH